MKVKFIFITSFILIAAVIGAFVLNKAQSATLDIKEGERIPPRTELYTVFGDKCRIGSIKGKKRVLFYLSSQQGYCTTNILEAIKNILGTITYEKVTYTLIWEENIPVKLLQNKGIDLSINFTLRGNGSLSQDKPAVFLLDEAGYVEYAARNDYYGITGKILDTNGKKKFAQNAVKAIRETVQTMTPVNMDRNKETLIMFLDNGCERCGDTRKLVEDNLTFLKSRFNLITLKSDMAKKDPWDTNLVTDYAYVYFQIFKSAYNVKVYPIFVITDPTGQIKRVLTDFSELLDLKIHD